MSQVKKDFRRSSIGLSAGGGFPVNNQRSTSNYFSRAFPALCSGLLLLLGGAGCSTVDPAANGSTASSSAAAKVASSGSGSKKSNDFYNIMARMDNTSHSGPRRSNDVAQAQAQGPGQGQPAGAAAPETASAADSRATQGSRTPAKTVAAASDIKWPSMEPPPRPQPAVPQATTTTLVVAAAAPASAPATPQVQAQAQVVQAPLIVTNKASQQGDGKSTLGDSAGVMTVKARGKDDDDDDTGKSTYAGAPHRTSQDLETAAVTGPNGSWVQRGVLSISVGCLGVGCFCLRMIRLGRFASKVVSSGLQASTRLRI